MRWHAKDSNRDGIRRHRRDCEEWMKFYTFFPEFSTYPRNVRLGLARDCFNPFGNMSTTYSIWLVVLIPYNFPPFICMKQPILILSIIIPSPRMVGNNRDVYQ